MGQYLIRRAGRAVIEYLGAHVIGERVVTNIRWQYSSNQTTHCMSIKINQRRKYLGTLTPEQKTIVKAGTMVILLCCTVKIHTKPRFTCSHTLLYKWNNTQY